MTVRFLIIISLMGLIPAFCVTAQTSTWWYPFGNAEATRRNPAPTGSQTADSIRIKWRTESLRNSPVLLAGGILSVGSENTQQVVGMAADTLVILTHRGVEGLRVIYRNLSQAYFNTPYDTHPFSTVLTGLFNPDSPTPNAEGRPSVIGVGVQRGEHGAVPWGFLADRTGAAIRQLKTAPVNAANPVNDSVSVYPVASFRDKLVPDVIRDTAMAIALVSQNNFAPSSAKMINSLRLYRLGIPVFPFPGSADSAWNYGFAPRPHAQPPSILSVRRGNGYDNYIGLSTSTYGFSPPVTVALPPELGDSTRSNVPYSVDVRLGRDLRALEARPTKDTGTQFNGQAHTYFMKLRRSKTDTGTYFRMMTENHDAASPGVAQITLASAEVSQVANNGIYSDPKVPRRDLAWSILVADLDGTAPDGLPDSLPNNTGDEIVAAYRMLDGSEISANGFYLFRYNTLNGTRPQPFGKFASTQPFSGRLMAAGDILADPESRQEILTAFGATLTIWQMRQYNDPQFLLNRPMDSLWSHTFDSPIVSVALADIDADGDNDILVCTKTATYALGRAQPQPFGTVVTDTTRYCIGKPIELSWKRGVGGGENGVRIILQNQSGAQTVLRDGYDPPPFTNRCTLSTGTLTPGTYRLLIQDLSVPSLIDSSPPFVMTATSISGLRLSKTPATVGAILRDTQSVTCVDRVGLHRSFNGTEWQDISVFLTIAGQSIRIALPVECPPDFACGTHPDGRMYLRLVDSAGIALPAYDTISYTVPAHPVAVTPDSGTSRQRSAGWDPALFPCGALSFSISFDHGGTWQQLGTVPASAGTCSFSIPSDAIGTADFRLCCASGSGCDYARRDSVFSVEIGTVDVVVPNPFNPSAPGSPYCTDGAAIIYRPTVPGPVGITIYDASRAVVRHLQDNRDHQSGVTYFSCWDGKNSMGEIVANGTYICVIQSGSSGRTVLPIIVMKR